MVHRRIGAMMGILLTMLMLASCAPPANGATPSPIPPETPVPETTPAPDIEITLALWNLMPPVSDGSSVSQQVYDTIRERFGLLITPWEITDENWRDKIEAAATDGTLPDFFVYDLRSGRINLMLWSDSGIIRDIPAAMWPQYPALYRVMEYVSRSHADPGGKMYFIPRTAFAFDQTAGQTTALYYRADWARTLGYADMDELPWERFIALLYSYAREDPDGNGSIDTRALTLAGRELGRLYEIFLMNFGVREWVLEDGKWIPGLISNRAKEALKWMNQLYRDGIIDPGYNNQTEHDAFNKFASGQAAMLAADGQRAGAAILRKQYWDTYNPNTVIADHVALLPQPLNPFGVSYNELPRIETATLVSADVDDDKLQRALALFDWLYTEEGLSYMRYGRQGVDYQMTEEGAKPIQTDRDGNPLLFSVRNPELSPLSVLSTWNIEGLSRMEDQDTFDLACQQQLEDFWWINNWRRPLFTDAMLTPELATFDLRSYAEQKLMYMMMMSTDIESDWAAYVDSCMNEYNTQGAIDEVNEYARQYGLTSEE